MSLAQALRISRTSCIALVGAGGKTTALFQIARELQPPVLITATTHLADFQTRLADHHYIIDQPEEFDLERVELSGVVLITGRADGSGRMSGVNEAVLDGVQKAAVSRSIPLIIEADGSRQLPVKAPAEHEPAIPDFVDGVVVVAGLSALGRPLTSQWVHRPERFAQLSGLGVDAEITPDGLVRVLLHPEGGLKNIPVGARKMALLNQADTDELQATAQGIARRLLYGFPSSEAYQAVILASLQTASVFAVHEPVAGIILAAGEAARFGQPKQLLPWHGQPMIRHISRTALDAGLSPVIVVSGAYTSQIRQALAGLDLTLIHNPDWQQGQSTSLRTGLKEAQGVGAAIFMLADQPLVPAALLTALVESHSVSLSPIVAPLVAGQRANPVLFDRITFAELMELSGDVGGRPLFARYRAEWISWHDANLLLDIDTLEDYQRLLELDL